MYAIVAPGLSCILSSWEDVERIKKLYPYPKWYKGYSTSDCANWLNANKYSRRLSGFSKYGDTFKDLYISAKYKIAADCVYFVLDLSKVGNVRLRCEGALIEYRGYKAYMKVPSLKVSNETIAGHLSAIYTLLKSVGDYVDIDIELPYYALYYALTQYDSNKSLPIVTIRDLINKRIGAVSYTLPLVNCLPEEDV